MTCRHKAGDPNCGTYSRKYDYTPTPPATPPATPDAGNFEIDEVERVGPHLVMRVIYPNCAKCEYEGKKVMVFLDVSEKEVLKWREIDPHFRNPQSVRSPKTAPTPAARFPATVEGWTDALVYARGKA